MAKLFANVNEKNFLTEHQIRSQGTPGLHGTQFAGPWIIVSQFLVLGNVYKDNILNKFKYSMLQKNLTVFKSRYIGNRVGWCNATKVSG